MRAYFLATTAALVGGCVALAPFDLTSTDGGTTDVPLGDPCDQVVCPPRTECVSGACVAVDPCVGIACDEGFAWALAGHLAVSIGARGLFRAQPPDAEGALFFALLELTAG